MTSLNEDLVEKRAALAVRKARIEAGSLGTVPVSPHDLAYTVRIVSPASPEAVAGLEAEVDRACPILNLLRAPQAVRGTVEHHQPAASDAAPAAQARAA